MKTVAIKDAKNRLTEIVRQAEAGETTVITRNGVPVADLVPHQPKKGGLNFDGLRQYLERTGQGRMFGEPSPDFDDPLPEDFLITPETD